MNVNDPLTGRQIMVNVEMKVVWMVKGHFQHQTSLASIGGLDYFHGPSLKIKI